MSEISDEDAQWLRDRFEKTAEIVGEESAKRSPGRGLSGSTAVLFGAAIAYAEVGGRFGGLDKATALDVLRSYVDEDAWDLSGLGEED